MKNAETKDATCIQYRTSYEIQVVKPKTTKIKSCARQTRRRFNLCISVIAKKKSMKRVNIKSTFQNLDATSTMVKMHRDSDAWSVGYFVLCSRGVLHNTIKGALWFTHGVRPPHNVSLSRTEGVKITLSRRAPLIFLNMLWLCELLAKIRNVIESFLESSTQ